MNVTIDPKASIIAKDYFALVLEFGNINSINSQNSNKINSSFFNEYPVVCRFKNVDFSILYDEKAKAFGEEKLKDFLKTLKTNSNKVYIFFL